MFITFKCVCMHAIYVTIFHRNCPLLCYTYITLKMPVRQKIKNCLIRTHKYDSLLTQNICYLQYEVTLSVFKTINIIIIKWAISLLKYIFGSNILKQIYPNVNLIRAMAANVRFTKTLYQIIPVRDKCRQIGVSWKQLTRYLQILDKSICCFNMCSSVHGCSVWFNIQVATVRCKNTSCATSTTSSERTRHEINLLRNNECIFLPLRVNFTWYGHCHLTVANGNCSVYSLRVCLLCFVYRNCNIINISDMLQIYWTLIDNATECYRIYDIS